MIWGKAAFLEQLLVTACGVYVGVFCLCVYLSMCEFSVRVCLVYVPFEHVYVFRVCACESLLHFYHPTHITTAVSRSEWCQQYAPF